MEIQLDELVTDRITGFKGRVVARAQYLFEDEWRFLVQPAVKADGTWVDAQWIEEARLDS